MREVIVGYIGDRMMLQRIIWWEDDTKWSYMWERK